MRTAENKGEGTIRASDDTPPSLTVYVVCTSHLPFGQKSTWALQGNSNQKRDKNSHDEHWVHKKSQRLGWARRTWDMRCARVKGVIKDQKTTTMRQIWPKSRVETIFLQERRTQQIGSEAVGGVVHPQGGTDTVIRCSDSVEQCCSSNHSLQRCRMARSLAALICTPVRAQLRYARVLCCLFVAIHDAEKWRRGQRGEREREEREREGGHDHPSSPSSLFSLRPRTKRLKINSTFLPLHRPKIISSNIASNWSEYTQIQRIFMSHITRGVCEMERTERRPWSVRWLAGCLVGCVPPPVHSLHGKHPTSHSF